MKKIRLNVDGLRVSSFETDSNARSEGTVIAAQATGFEPNCRYPTADYHSCPPGATGEWCSQLFEDTDMRMCCTIERCSAAGMCW
ncbi:MAG TPA: hypothetical protein VM759_03280 [Longimicrobium sp.]|nr:hypothetical protein [Longimicrobium sp.]